MSHTPEETRPDAAGPGEVGPALRLSTQTGPAGEQIATRAGQDATATLVWTDGSPATDVTTTLADLLLLGWIEASLAAEATAPAAETVDVGGLVTSGAWEAYARDSDGEVYQLTEHTVATWAAAGIVALITAGVAYEASQGAAAVPDTPATLTDTDPHPEDEQ